MAGFQKGPPLVRLLVRFVVLPVHQCIRQPHRLQSIPVETPAARGSSGVQLGPGPNLRLKAERLRLGMTQAELADAIAALAWHHHHERLGVDAMMVSKWERGVKRPRRLYRQLLCLLYSRTDQELGLRPPPLPHPSTDFDGDDMNRRDFLKGAALFGLAATGPMQAVEGVSRLLEAPSLDPTTVAAFASVVEMQRGIYWSCPPRSLFDATAAHAQLGLDLLRTACGPQRQELARAVAHAALLSGRLAFFDLTEAQTAQRSLSVARELADQFADHQLTAAVYGHLAFLPGFQGDMASAAAALDVAQAKAIRSSGPRTRSWLHCVRAEIAARNGAAREALAQAARARDALDSPGTDPLWLDFFDASRLAGFTGYVQLLTGDLDGAAESLEGACAALPASAVKQRSVWLLDRATAHARRDPDHALDLATQAVDDLQGHWYPTARDRFPALRSALSGTPYAGELDERLRPLSAMAS